MLYVIGFAKKKKKKSFGFFHNSLWKNPNFLANLVYMKVVKRVNSKNCHHKEKRSISVLDGGVSVLCVISSEPAK